MSSVSFPVVIGLGTNCGDRAGFLRWSIRELKSLKGFKLQALSPIYESEAMLPENAPESWNLPYLNLCALAETRLSPERLLEELKEIEKTLGRKPRERWAPREIDLDILAMGPRGARTHESPKLRIPHPGLVERPFALLPFADLAPDWMIAVEGTSCSARQWASPWTGRSEGIPFNTKRVPLAQNELMGIINVTPDSFSDGGSFIDPEKAIAQAKRLVHEGATILDLGAESTRPRSTPVSPDEEWRRLEPILSWLSENRSKINELPVFRPTLSIDTRHANTAARAIRAGADWINDVSGSLDPEMKRVVADSGADLVIMHSLSIPPRPDLVLRKDLDPVEQVLAWAEERLTDLESSGIERSRVIVDPGIGFGKTIEQNIQLIRHAKRFHELGTRILVGHSRKSFMSALHREVLPPETPASERDLETAAMSQHLARSGVDYLRVHDVALNARALRAWAWSDGAANLGSTTDSRGESR